MKVKKLLIILLSSISLIFIFAPTVYAGGYERLYVTARLDGKWLYVETSEDIKDVRVNDKKFSDILQNRLDLHLEEVGGFKEEKELKIQGINDKGEVSEVFIIQNPFYENPAPSPTPPATNTISFTEAEIKDMLESVKSLSSENKATSENKSTSENKATTETEVLAEKSEAPSEVPVRQIPDGNGSTVEVVDKNSDEREFVTVQTKDGNNFHMIIDKERTDNNVYLLTEVKNSDLTSFAEKDNTLKTSKTENTSAIDEVSKLKTEPPVPVKKASSPIIYYVVFGAIAFVGIYYFKFYKPKKELENSEGGEEYDENNEYGDEEYEEQNENDYDEYEEDDEDYEDDNEVENPNKTSDELANESIEPNSEVEKQNMDSGNHIEVEDDKGEFDGFLDDDLAGTEDGLTERVDE